MEVPFRFVECRVDPDTQRMRLAARDSEGDEGAWAQIARDFDERFVAPDELAIGERILVDSSGALADSVAYVLDALDRSRTDDGRLFLTGAPASTQRVALPDPPAGVTFDCWRTLLVETNWPAAHARRVDALSTAAREAGHEASREAARQAFDEAWREHMLAWTRGVATGAPEIARHALAALGADMDGSALDALVADWQEASHSSGVEALEGARETLEILAERGIPRGLVCDTGLTPGRVVRHWLDAVGLLDLLDFCAFSDEVGAPKPDARAFRAALVPMGVDPAAAVHVGDLRRTDVAGARALGMGTIRLRAAYDDPGPLPEADEVADSHRDVARLLTG
jgi:putative hydrolase of the HAD superfamily